MKDGYLVIDELAYMGSCNTTELESEEEEDRRWPKRKGGLKPKQVRPQITTTTMESRPLTS